MTPVIGITCDYTAKKKEPTFFLGTRYVRSVEEIGGIPLLLPITGNDRMRKRFLDQIDGLLIPGSGPDIDPALYGERQRWRFPLMSPERASFEIEMVSLALEKDRPILGICGGMQILTVATGGSLHQDIFKEIPHPLPHRQETPVTSPAHSVRISPGTCLFEIVGQETIRVNSSHHQCVKSVGPVLRSNAVARDGVIEGVESPRHSFVLGIQWHPEYLYKKRGPHRRIFERFLAACGSIR